MKLRKGFLRMYIAATACWALFCGIILLSTRTESPPEEIIAVIVGIPLLAYVLLFVAIPWIWRGFGGK